MGVASTLWKVLSLGVILILVRGVKSAQKLELLVGRRDQIAHESDMSYTEKREITQMEVEDAITFIDSFVACVDSHV